MTMDTIEALKDSHINQGDDILAHSVEGPGNGFQAHGGQCPSGLQDRLPDRKRPQRALESPSSVASLCQLNSVQQKTGLEGGGRERNARKEERTEDHQRPCPLEMCE